MDKSYYSLNKNIIKDRNIDEFVGICRGILADDELNYDEKKFLKDWIKSHNLQQNDMIKEIYYELENNKSLDDLKKILLDFIGGKTLIDKIKSMTTKLPLDDLKESIKFENKTFCLTGKFSSAYGNRQVLEDEIEAKGGICQKRVSLNLDYLVVGEFGNDDWRHSNYGRKIETALKYKNKGNSNIKIISETKLLKDL
jgi:NAD-dependent DNA ligase